MPFKPFVNVSSPDAYHFLRLFKKKYGVSTRKFMSLKKDIPNFHSSRNK